ncbi:DUF1854 domain-containing protein [Janthinobacterium sp. BJB1]|uniref:cyanophycin metabolism-associated DUF1854 family protein n=1 Tax=Janthinobacterium sp. GW458P TaxID=1981504 RepID=UPI000A31EE67|nr:DUF1854 domain-containing protein [Janthinobacterium sp. GW458P]MBE3023224.1 DUF1854 domain-containing protein [Janthinobacterium sp. GW458P]PHV16198.1 DUF1854 domain-containing protein [Janthinobacterium sp. BJB303]PJC98522.1 DUF1854 domain-containing protein [Janthinobacterium sp. BJB1]
MASTTFTLSRDPFGKLVMTDADGQVFEGVAPVRAFPIQSPDEGISLVLGDGKEVAWIDRLDALPEPTRGLLQEELEGREFMPEIARVKSVSSFATPCTWYVDTDRGETQFVLKGEEDIRRIGATSLLIADNHGIHFLIRDMFNIDKTTRKILDRFL